MIWESDPPDECPFEPSESVTGIRFTGRHRAYTRADTWYPYWADDDICYSPWTDGTFDGDPTSHAHFKTMDCSSDSRHWSNEDIPGKSRTGQARIHGDNPLNLTIENLGVQIARTAPYGGRYPCASIVHDGVWYYGTYCLDETDRDLNWDVLGPFMGFQISTNGGKTWRESPYSPTDGGLFGETGKDGGKVKIGAPHVVYHGQANRLSPDGKVYLVAHGASRPNAEAAWIAGDEVYLLRVTPSIETMNDPAAYAFFAGQDTSGYPIWTNDFTQTQPIVDWHGRVGHANMTYVSGIEKYLLVITDGWPTTGKMNTYILEADSIIGPWKLVTFMKEFGQQAYFVNIPPKFISDDGRTMWLCYSANFTNHSRVHDTYWEPNPPGSHYALCFQEIELQITD